MKKQYGKKSGFTLIELLVVVTILGLLAVVVLPAFTAGGDKRLLRGAAERLDTHLKQAAARATGKPRGSAVWLDANGGTAVFDLNFARMPAGMRKEGKVTWNPDVKLAEVNPPIPESTSTWSLIYFDMNTAEFQVSSDNHKFIKFASGQNKFNTAFPNSPKNKIGYVVYNPPSGPLITSRPTVLPERVCVDLDSSTIGVDLFGDYRNGGSPELLSTYDRLAICFDVYGKPNEIWGWSGSTPTRILLRPGKPIALLCTLAYQSGSDEVLDYTQIKESNPGAGWQNPDAFWVVIDPKTGRNLIVENGFEPGSLEDAQEFIVKDLLSQQ